MRSATTGHSATGVLGQAGSALAAVEGIAATVVGSIIIAFLTFFMLLEEPDWRRRCAELIPERNRDVVDRIGAGVYRSVGGFVTGNLVASLLAVAFTVGTVSALVALGLLVVYHVVEGHTLRPYLYGRAVKLSPLAILVAILLGTEIAGILGALVAIPVAGSIQVIVGELLLRRDERRRSLVIG